MNRRSFVAGMFLPILGRSSEQFEVSGQFDRSGQPGEGYFVLGQSLALMINPEQLPSMHAQAEKLVGRRARIRLEEA